MAARWEWRTFGESFGAAEEALAALTAERVDESDELYLLSADGDASVKLRDGLMDVKRLEHVDGDGLEQWTPALKAPFAGADLELLVGVLHCGRLLVLPVHKHRAHYTVEGAMAELSDLRTEHGSVRTIVLESEDPAQVLAAVRSLGLAARRNVCMARGLKALAGFGSQRFAVIDVGTNSVKLHIGERRADGTWSTVVDRADVTRLGEGVGADGTLQPEPMRRTLEAVAGMAAEATEAGAAEIAAVGTAGMRAAPNGPELVDAVAARCGVRIEIIPGVEESRLGYLAARSGVEVGRGALVVFDTGGGSSQFTFGRGDEVGEQFSVPVGAARLTERYGLDGPVSDEALAAALDGIASELDSLDGRPAPDELVGMGGAATNLAAVSHGLPEYDADVVQGTRLDRAEIDRQIELYRTSTAEERRAVVGLQPNRAEVILAGACVVRTVLEKLDRDSFVVSDRGVRHGVLADRFALGPPRA